MTPRRDWVQQEGLPSASLLLSRRVVVWMRRGGAAVGMTLVEMWSAVVEDALACSLLGQWQSSAVMRRG
jgi:hypothetical protein